MSEDAIYAALVDRDAAALTDALAALDAPGDEAIARLQGCVERAFTALADVDWPASATVNDVVFDLARRTPLAVSRAELDERYPDRPSRRGRLADASPDQLRAALTSAYDRIDVLAAERTALEDRVAELAGARVLADSLAEELERDEWIRARLRKLKATLPLRIAIAVRRRLRRAPPRA